MKANNIFLIVLFSIIDLVITAPKFNESQEQRCKEICTDVNGAYSYDLKIPLCSCETSKKLNGAEFIKVQSKANEWQLPFEIKQANRQRRYNEGNDDDLKDLIPVFEHPIIDAKPTTDSNTFKQRLTELKQHFAVPKSSEISSDKITKFKSKLDKLRDDLVATPKLITKTPLLSLRFNKPATTNEPIVGEAEPTSQESESNPNEFGLQETTNHKLSDLKIKLDKLREDLVAPIMNTISPLLSLRFNKGFLTTTVAIVGNMQSNSEEIDLSEQEITTNKLTDFKSKLDKLRDDLVLHTKSPLLSLRFNKGATTEFNPNNVDAQEHGDKLDQFKIKLAQLKDDLVDTYNLNKPNLDVTTESIVGAMNPSLFNPNLNHHKFALPTAPLLPFNNARAAIDPLHPITHTGLHGLRSRINKIIDGIDHGIHNPTLTALDPTDIKNVMNQVNQNNLHARMDITTPSLFWKRFFGLKHPGNLGNFLRSSGPNATNEAEIDNENNEINSQEFDESKEVTTHSAKIVQPKNLIQSSEDEEDKEIDNQTIPPTVKVQTREILQSKAFVGSDDKSVENFEDYKVGVTKPGVTTETMKIENENNVSSTSTSTQKNGDVLTTQSDITVNSKEVLGSKHLQNIETVVVASQPGNFFDHKELGESVQLEKLNTDLATTHSAVIVEPKESDITSTHSGVHTQSKESETSKENNSQVGASHSEFSAEPKQMEELGKIENIDSNVGASHSAVIVQPKEFEDSEQFDDIDTYLATTHSSVIVQPKELEESVHLMVDHTTTYSGVIVQPKELHEFDQYFEQDNTVGAALPGVIVQPAFLDVSSDEDDLIKHDHVDKSQSDKSKKILELHDGVNKNSFNFGPSKYIAKIPKKATYNNNKATTANIKELGEENLSDSLMMENYYDD